MTDKIDQKKGIVGGTVWTTLSFVVVTLVYLLRISVLTRYLDKSDFGLVAIVLMVLGFTNIFADLGVSSAILSQNKIDKKEYSSLYWGGFFMSIILYGIVSLSSPLFASFYNEPTLNYLIPVMGVDLIISSLGRQFTVFKQKEFKFKELAFIKIVSELFSLCIAVFLAINGYGVWSLIVSLLTASFVNSILNLILGFKSHPIVFYFSYIETKHLYRIGFYQTGSQILDYISSQIDILILGKILPMHEMGVYSIIKNLVLRVYTSINQVVTKVSVPIFTSLQSDLNAFKSKYLQTVSIIIIVNTVCYYVIFICANETLNLFYGEQFMKYSNILKYLCLWGIFSSVLNCASVLIVISTGRTDLGFRWTQFRLLMNPVFILIGAYLGGILGTAISQAVYSFITLFFYRSIVVKKILANFSNLDLLKVLYRPLLLCLLSYPPMYFIRYLLIQMWGDILYLNLMIIGGVTLILFFVLFKKELLNIKRL